MNRTKKTVVAVAVCLVVLGIALGAAGFGGMDFSFKSLDIAKYDEKTYPIEGQVTDVYVESLVSDVRLVPSDGGPSRVVCTAENSLQHTVSVENGTLTVRETDESKWYDHIGFNLNGSSHIMVYLPAGEYKTLTVKTDTGDTEVPKEFSFASADVSSVTGDASLYTPVKNKIDVRTDTGEVNIGGTSPATIKVQTHTGDVTVFSASQLGAVSVETDTGEVDMVEVQCAELLVRTKTGEIELESVTASDRMELETDTGDVELKACDAGSIFITTDTGDIEGTLMSPKLFEASSDTGRVDVPSPLPGGRCVINSDTGDIKIEVLE